MTALSRKRQRTRTQIADAAAALFERYGYEAVTMEQIAAEAGVARGTLYNHFAVKEAVLAEWMHARLAQDLAPLMAQALAKPSFAARVATVLEASAQWWEDHRQYAAPYLRFRFQAVRDGAGGHDGSDLVAAYAGLIDAAQRSREIRDDVPPVRLARYLHFLYLSALLAWLGDADASLQAEFAHALEFFLQGAAYRKPIPSPKDAR
ncbi:TetR/AcrR family transcriptional regulator [Vulcaniibacterium tengchongense]|uniref:TetR family transcriptional regulator n=1 Tax=Vulcaniibacterium tengchongense TaxID=1273429 RepID=A0A3N4W1G9_9GAMM|nr:TetR/AcrR family transcriptional regulator [Vulcaniibacterium tengchongense]RPE79880.1 TetR family transcriptional regulator [Vulcaniibacterium tengchongense]